MYRADVDDATVRAFGDLESFRSHDTTAPLLDAKRWELSGFRATPVIDSPLLSLSLASCSPVFASHRNTIPLPAPVAISFPSRLNATAVTPPRCPSNFARTVGFDSCPADRLATTDSNATPTQ